MEKKLGIISATLFFLFFVVSCRPAIGTAWYKRSVSAAGKQLSVFEIKVNGISAIPQLTAQPTDGDQKKAFSEATSYTVKVPSSVDEIDADSISVLAVTSLTNQSPIEAQVTINGDSVPLAIGQEVPVTIKIQDAAGKYDPVEKIIKITRAEASELVLNSLFVCGVDAGSGSVQVPFSESVITAEKIDARFTHGDITEQIPVELEYASVPLKENEPVEIHIFVKGKEGLYTDFESVVTVTRQAQGEDEDDVLEIDAIYALGIPQIFGEPIKVPEVTEKLTKDDLIITFKKFGYAALEMQPGEVDLTGKDSAMVTLTVAAHPGKYQAWSTTLMIKKDTRAVFNPKDKNGNKKYVVKIIEHKTEVDPFDYFTEDSNGFFASQFNDWVVYISGFNNSTNLPSYKLKVGTWNGNTYAAPDFGSGVKRMGNVTMYRYFSRSDRWGGAIPADYNSTKEARFIFFRFTASGGVTLDNSIFCVDTYSKFVFYYSEPTAISSLGVPSDWVDYSTPSSGVHQQFAEPFYLSDPAGYVKPDGSVVLYQWSKDNIAANIYHAQKNSSYTKPAQQKAAGAGYSPYRNAIEKTTYSVETSKNPNYTVSEPVIVGQPEAVYARVNDSVMLRVKTLAAVDGETLSYQWYMRNKGDTGEGTLIPGATDAEYRPDTASEINAYCWCAVTNTNTDNGKQAILISDPARLYIVSGTGPISIDAEAPKILIQPESAVIPIAQDVTITLTTGAASMDNGVISYQWFVSDTLSGQGAEIDDAAANTYSFKPYTGSENTKYYYCKITNRNDNAEDSKEISVETKRAKIEIETSYKLDFLVDGEIGGRLVALYNGVPIESGTYIKANRTVKFTATPDHGYKVKDWQGADVLTYSSGNTLAELKITDKPVRVIVSFERIGGRILTVKAKSIKNIDLDNYADDTPSSGFLAPKKWVQNHTNFETDFQANVAAGTWKSIWSFNRESGQVEKGSSKENGGDEVANRYFETGQIPSSFELFTKIIKHDKLYGPARNPWYFKYKDEISDETKDKIKFEYVDDGENGYWKLDAAANTNLGKDKVTITVPKDFKLTFGREEDFTVHYDIDNLSEQTSGSLEVTYTISWK